MSDRDEVVDVFEKTSNFRLGNLPFDKFEEAIFFPNQAQEPVVCHSPAEAANAFEDGGTGRVRKVASPRVCGFRPVDLMTAMTFMSTFLSKIER